MVIIPTYDECGNIENILDTVMDLHANFHVRVLDQFVKNTQTHSLRSAKMAKPL